jgi:thioredoxin-like negative regulator of GroEL
MPEGAKQIMIIKMVLVATLLLIVPITTFAGGVTAPVNTPELKKTVGANGKATLIFFQNPNGAPCKKQKEIIERLHSARKGNFNIAAVSTLKPEDQRGFYDYGVRSLPTLVLVDRNGKVARFFSPGIQEADVLISALDGLK